MLTAFPLIHHTFNGFQLTTLSNWLSWLIYLRGNHFEIGYSVVLLFQAGSGKAKWTPIEIDPPKYERQNSRGGVTRVRGGGDIRSPRESPRFRRNGPVNNNQYNKGNDYSWYLMEARICLA